MLQGVRGDRRPCLFGQYYDADDDDNGMSPGDAQDADADGGGVHVQEFLHHHGNVSTDALLRVHWSHLVWLCQVRRRPWQVS